MHSTARLLAVLVTACLTAASAGQEESESKGTIHRVAVIGASATAGFGVTVEVRKDGRTKETGMTLTDVFKASRDDQDVVFLDLGSGLFFMRPISYARSSVSRAVAWEAELVLGIDFLFWCLYGNDDGKGGRLQNESQRLEKLEMGLATLDELDVPLVIGDIPDMTAIGGYILARSQRPEPATVQKANERIREWVSERPDVEVAGLHDFIVKIQAKESFKIGPYSWNLSEEDIAIIGPDELHPTIDGLIALAQSLDQAARTLGDVESRLPPLELQREVILARLRGQERKPRQPRKRSLQGFSLPRRSPSRLRSCAPSARSSAFTIATLR